MLSSDPHSLSMHQGVEAMILIGTGPRYVIVSGAPDSRSIKQSDDLDIYTNRASLQSFY